MRHPRLFCDPLQPGVVRLSKEEAHHGARVLRLRKGHAVELFDGKGRVSPAEVLRIREGDLELQAGEPTRMPFECRVRLTLAVAMTKAHRQGYLIEKCTELGVAVIQPLETERSVVRPGDGAVEKWRRRAIEAAKQARRAWVPVIEPVRSLPRVVEEFGRYDRVLTADARGDGAPLSRHLCETENGASVLVLIGPEGGWSDAERTLVAQAGAQWIRLAPTVLRTETACAAVCAAVAEDAVTRQGGGASGRSGVPTS
ncbi:MAG: 16S rRNA (uracil(1498)-N(3))-methyltransferase [Planctomycetota bacterium]|nr:MAG: 16S rRNA (uracil(1498)-N(3))-methyltransferase [Planctomycetota bacterium]